MQIECLGVRLTPAGLQVVRYRVVPEDLRQLPSLITHEACYLLVVQNPNLDFFRQAEIDFVDRGRKDERKPLKEYLLGHRGRMPLLETGYRTRGRLWSSMHGFLEHARTRREKGIYVIGISDNLFRDSWEVTHESASVLESLRAPRSQAWPPRTENAAPESVSLSRRLPPIEVPSKVYLSYIGESVECDNVRRLIMLAAQTEIPVLITGKTGTGKEVVARLIHEQSKRVNNPFMVVNCGAIPTELLESELFGHKKGAFTGAIRNKPGLWNMAHEGTLFLDEIGDLSLGHQVKVLRALNSGEIQAVGDVEQKSVDVRVLAATNRDLYAMVRSNQFREDLYYRLRQFRIVTPSLGKRPEDIRVLAHRFWEKITKEKGRLTDAFVNELQTYSWPGNVRELKSVLNTVLATFQRTEPTTEDLKLVFALEGRMGTGWSSIMETEPESAKLHDARCLVHLNRVSEVVRACKVVLRPLRRGVEDTGADQQEVLLGFQQRLSELDSLCDQPLMFRKESIFRLIHQLKGELYYFNGLLQKDAVAAMQYWKTEVDGEVENAISTLFEEVRSSTDES